MKQIDIHRANIDEHNEYALMHDYNVGYIRNIKNREYYHSMIINELNEKFGSFNKLNILEIGCGTGTFCDMFLKLDVKSYTGIDISDGMIERAKKKFIDTDAKFIVSPIENIDLTIKYDVIISSSFLHHMYDLDYVINKVYDLLIDGGIYIGMHEPKTNSKISKVNIIVSILDEIYATWFGYDGWYQKSFNTKLNYTLKTILRPITNKLFHKKSKDINKINLVDYQLNNDFESNLQNIIKNLNSKTVYYTYFHNHRLSAVGKLKNYFYIVLNKV